MNNENLIALRYLVGPEKDTDPKTSVGRIDTLKTLTSNCVSHASEKNVLQRLKNLVGEEDDEFRAERKRLFDLATSSKSGGKSHN